MPAYGRHYERLKAERSGARLRGPPDPRRAPAARAALGRTALPRAVRAPDGRRVPGHQPAPARPHPRAAAAPTRASSSSATSSSRSTASATPTSRSSAPSARRPRRRPTSGSGSCRCAATSARGPRSSRPSTRSAAIAAGGLRGARRRRASRRPAATARRRPRSSCCSPSSDGWDAEGIDLSALPGEDTSSRTSVAEARDLARAPARAGRRRGRAPAGWSSCCAPSRTSPPTRRRSSAAGLAPYVVGGRGYWSHQQVEDMLRLLGCVANPLDDETLFGALACPAVGVSPDALWMLRRARLARTQHAPRVAGGRAPLRARAGRSERADAARTRRPSRRRSASRPRAGSSASATRTPPACGRFCERLARLRAAAPLLSLEALTERTARELGYDLAVLMREARHAAATPTCAS